MSGKALHVCSVCLFLYACKMVCLYFSLTIATNAHAYTGRCKPSFLSHSMVFEYVCAIASLYIYNSIHSSYCVLYSMNLMFYTAATASAVATSVAFYFLLSLFFFRTLTYIIATRIHDAKCVFLSLIV